MDLALLCKELWKPKSNYRTYDIDKGGNLLQTFKKTYRICYVKAIEKKGFIGVKNNDYPYLQSKIRHYFADKNPQYKI